MKEFSIIVPEYNELSRDPTGFEEQLAYFSDLSRAYDVKLIDDASRDGSWERIQEYIKSKKPNFQAIRMKKNGQKVGAIKKGVECSPNKYVLLTDFDSRITNPEEIPNILSHFEENQKLAGIALKVVPENNSLMSKLQDLDYAMGRVIGALYLRKSKKLRCIPGAGGIWRKDVLLELLNYHSGRHNGDDMETTALAQKHGYDVIYNPSIVIKTKTPQGIKDLFRQRRRWELGALETFDKEKRFYLNQVKNLRNRFGHITLWEWYNWASLPLTAIIAGMSIKDGNPYLLSYYLWDLGLTTLIISLAKNEIQNKRELVLLPLMPFYRAIANFPAKLSAFYNFSKTKI